MPEAISQHKLLAMGKTTPQQSGGPGPTNKSVKDGGGKGGQTAKPAAKNY